MIICPIPQICRVLVALLLVLIALQSIAIAHSSSISERSVPADDANNAVLHQQGCDGGDIEACYRLGNAGTPGVRYGWFRQITDTHCYVSTVVARHQMNYGDSWNDPYGRDLARIGVALFREAARVQYGVDLTMARENPRHGPAGLFWDSSQQVGPGEPNEARRVAAQADQESLSIGIVQQCRRNNIPIRIVRLDPELK